MHISDAIFSLWLLMVHIVLLRGGQFVGQFFSLLHNKTVKGINGKYL